MLIDLQRPAGIALCLTFQPNSLDTTGQCALNVCSERLVSLKKANRLLALTGSIKPQGRLDDFGFGPAKSVFRCFT
jgi:hypothetical protein